MLSVAKSRLSAAKSGFAGKTIIFTLFFLLLVTQVCFAQWYLQMSGTMSWLHDVYFNDESNGWAVGWAGEILRTTNSGIIWTSQNTGNTLYSVYFTDGNTGWAAGGKYGEGIIVHTTDGGIKWIGQKTGTNNWLNDIYFLDENMGWAVGDSGTIIHTTDAGETWLEQSTGTKSHMQGVHFVNPDMGWIIGIEIHDTTSKFTIFHTNNGGATWVSQWEWTKSEPFGICFTDVNNGWVVGGGYWGPSIILHTNNGGLTWFTQSSGIMNALNDVQFTNVTNGWAVGDSGTILHTTNGGITWVSMTSGTGEPLYGVYFVDDSTGWTVGSAGVILHTTNSGNPVPVELNSFTASANGREVILNWSTATELDNQGFEVQRKFSSNNFITIGLVKGHGTTTSPNQYTFVDKLIDAGKYFYRLKQIDFGGTFDYSDIVEVEMRVLDKFTLEQNYPNPFNPTTTIGYVLQEKSNVKLKLLNTIGEEIKVPINEEQDKGYHSVDFNASDLASGVYFYRLQAGGYTGTKKMILVR